VFNTFGETRANDLGLAFDPIPGGYHVHGDVTSRVFGLRANTPNPIGIVLNLGGRFGGRPEISTIGGSFDDPGQRLQLSFATTGPVLNDIPAGLTVSGAGVVNNRWDDPFAGDLVVADCDDPALAQATTIRGSLILRALTDCPTVTFPQVTHIGGDLVIDGNDGDLTIDTGSVGEAIDASGNGGDLAIDTGSVGGAIDVSGNSGDLTIDPGTAGGDLDISDNPGADVIDVGAGQIGGDLTITDDGTAVVNANDTLTVSGDADIESSGGGMLDLAGVSTESDETVAADGADGVEANTAGGATDVSVLGGTAAMHVVLPDGTFDEPVAFTIARGGDDPAEAGTASGGASTLVDPLAGYGFAFAVLTLGADARLSFTIDLSALDAGTRAALLEGIASGSGTIVTKADDPSSVYGAFARCTGTQTPEADG
jgi:hypothetical protein